MQRWRSSFRFCLCAALALASAVCNMPGPLADKPGPPPDPRLANSSRLERNGWIFVHVEGPPATLGFQHGSLLAPEVTDLLRVTKPLLLQLTKKDWPFYR